MSKQQPIADGTHDGFRWWLTRQPEFEHPCLIVSGFDGPRYVLRGTQMPDASPAKVKQFIESLKAEVSAPKQKRNRP